MEIKAEITTVESLQDDNYIIYFQCSDCTLIFNDESSHAKHMCSLKTDGVNVLGKPVSSNTKMYTKFENVPENENRLALLERAALEIGDGDISVDLTAEIKECEEITLNTIKGGEKEQLEKEKRKIEQDRLKMESVLIYVCSKCNVAFKELNFYKEHPCSKKKVKKIKKKRHISNTDINQLDEDPQLSYQCTKCETTYVNMAAFEGHLCIWEADDSLDDPFEESDTENRNEDTFQNLSTSNIELDSNVQESHSIGQVEKLTRVQSNEKSEDTDDSSTNQISTQNRRRKKNKTPTPWLCSVCNKYFNTRYYLVHHSCEPPSKNPLPYGALGKPPYICTKCGSSYKHKPSFCRHIHHECKMNERPQKIIPPIRPRNSVANKTNQKATTESSKVKPFQCPVCKKSFARKYYLVHHSCNPPWVNPLPRGALGKPPFLCSGCGVVYKHKQSYCRHIHHECGKGRKFFKNYSGKYVGKSKKKKKTLETHVCSLCNTEFRDQDALEVHVQVDHLTL